MLLNTLSAWGGGGFREAPNTHKRKPPSLSNSSLMEALSHLGHAPSAFLLNLANHLDCSHLC